MWTFHSLGYLCWHSIGSRRIDCAALLMSSLLATFAYNSCDNDDIPTIYRSFSLPDSNEPLPREENKIESSAIWCIEVREAVQRDSTLSRTECVVTVGGFNEALLPSCIKNDQNSKLNRTVEFPSVFSNNRKTQPQTWLSDVVDALLLPSSNSPSSASSAVKWFRFSASWPRRLSNAVLMHFPFSSSNWSSCDRFRSCSWLHSSTSSSFSSSVIMSFSVFSSVNFFIYQSIWFDYVN